MITFLFGLRVEVNDIREILLGFQEKTIFFLNETEVYEKMVFSV